MPHQPDHPAAPEAPPAAPSAKVEAATADTPEDAPPVKKAAKKATAAKKASPAKKTASAKKSTGKTSEPVRRTSAEDERAALTARLLDHPGYAPELLALAAVYTLGPAAKAWSERIRETYPAATPDGLARLATSRFSRLAGVSGTVSAAGGLLAPLAGLTALAWAQANLVLHLAAAYGQDPTDPDRAVDLLVLARVHPDDKAARAALATAQQTPAEPEEPLYLMAEAGGRLATPLARRSGTWLSRRLVSRLLPGTAMIAGAAGGSLRLQRLAARAVARYRGGVKIG